MDTDASVLGGKGIEVLLEENVLRSDIGKDQINLGLIPGGPATDNGPHDLQHRGDSGTTGDHSEVPNHVGSVSESTLGAADTDSLAHNERSHVLRDVALGVGLDEDVKVARLVVARHRSVRADNFLGGAIRLGKLSTDGDVLADGETEDGRGVIELEAVAGYKADELESNIAVAEGIGRGIAKLETYMATLWEMTVFSSSSNSWKTSGFRTFLTSAIPSVSLHSPSKTRRDSGEGSYLLRALKL